MSELNTTPSVFLMGTFLFVLSFCFVFCLFVVVVFWGVVVFLLFFFFLVLGFFWGVGVCLFVCLFACLFLPHNCLVML